MRSYGSCQSQLDKKVFKDSRKFFFRDSKKTFNIHGHIGPGNRNLFKKRFVVEGFQRLQRLQKVVYRPQKVLRGPKFKVNSYWSRQSHFVKKKGFINAVEGFQKGTPESFLKTPESFSETPERFRRIHIHFEVILVMAITRAEKVCCGKFANCFLVFCGLVGRACNRERL